METKLDHIKLIDIVLSKTNPRKTFDQDKIDELAESIAEHGVIQPVRVRPKQGKYELVCGERRYRASKQAGRKDIPAVISELTDQQAREIQLIENFQREDVHPMEEAVAIFSAIKTGHYTTDELSHKVGKTKKYIAQRMKLNELVPELQKEFFDNKFNLTAALMLVTISDVDQLKFFKNASVNTHYNYSTDQVKYFIKQCQGNLNTAVFDLTDPTLSPEFGPCTTCPFNSRNANLLFPDDTKEHVCMNQQDYQKKTEVHFQRASMEAFKDPTVVLVTASYSLGDEEKKLTADGHVILKNYVDYEPVKQPERQSLSRDQFDTQEEFDDAMIEANAAYERECLAFEKKQMNGKLVKAFVVAGDQKGKNMFVELKKKGEEKTATTVIHAGTTEVNDIQTEINRLKEKEVRAKELDAEKVYQKVQAAISQHEPFITNQYVLSLHESIGLVIGLYLNNNWTAREFLNKKLKIDTDHSKLVLYNKLLSLGREAFPIINTFLRLVIVDNNNSSTDLNPKKSGAPAIITTIAKDYIQDTVSEYEFEQQNITVARIEKVNKRLVELEQQKTDLERNAKNKKSVKSLIP